MALALTLLATATADAAAPAVESDETVYINLDYYGVPTDTRIVKGVSLNGHTEFTDYGNYDSVYNMSSFDEPDLTTPGETHWTISDNSLQRFYYECLPQSEEPLTLPWNFDVSYKLNGVPVTAEECAGAKGLVEITLKAVPNRLASAYYRNNMMLICATGIDMSESLSIDAPGAQIQSFGTYKLVVFMGLPGEESTFTVRIGSDSFESMGMIICMAPATLSSLDILADVKDVKDRVDASGDALYAGLTGVLNTLDSMKSGVDTLSGGIQGINDVRQKLITSRGELDPKTDEALEALEALAGESESLIPTLTQMKGTISSLNTTATGMLDTVKQTSLDITEYENLLVQLYSNLDELQSFFGDTQDYIDAMRDFRDDFEGFRDETKDFMSDVREKTGDFSYSDELIQFSGNLEQVRKDLQDLGAASDMLSDSMKVLELAMDTMGVDIPTIPGGIVEGVINDLDTLQSALSSVSANTGYLLEAVAGATDPNSGISDMLLTGQTISENMDDIIGTADELWDELMVLTQSAETLEAPEFEALDEYENLPYKFAQDGQRVSELAVGTMESINRVLGELPALSSELTDITSLSTETIDKANSLTTSVSKTLDSTAKALEQAKTTLRSVREQADASTQQSVDGLLDVLQKAVQSNNTGSIQNAADSIHEAIDDAQVDLEDDTNVLNIDSNAKLESVTSTLNPSPTSLQFIMRTKEISLEDVEDEAENDGEAEDVGVIARIKNIFTKLFEAITSVFSSDE